MHPGHETENNRSDELLVVDSPCPLRIAATRAGVPCASVLLIERADERVQCGKCYRSADRCWLAGQVQAQDLLAAAAVDGKEHGVGSCPGRMGHRHRPECTSSIPITARRCPQCKAQITLATEHPPPIS